jgi:hypothetical protein
MKTRPKLGAKVLLHGKGFNADRVGRYIGDTPEGQMVLNMDPQGILPDGDRLKKEIVGEEDLWETLG